MTRRTKKRIAVFAAVAIAVLGLSWTVLAQTGGGFDLSRSGVAGGGGESTGGTFGLTGSAGQSGAGGALTGGTYSLTGGVLAIPRDSDVDGLPDVGDPCPSDPTNTCDPNGSAAAIISSADGGTLTTGDGTTSMTIPAGSLPANTTISVTEDGTGSTFELTGNLGQALGIIAVNIGPPGATFDPPATIVFAWPDADNNGRVDGTNVREDNLIITKDNAPLTGKCKDEAGCDTVGNTFTFTVSSLSLFALVGPLLQVDSFMTDSQFATISSFDAVFTKDKASGTLKLPATNPGTYFFNKILTSEHTFPLAVTTTVKIPASLEPPGPLLDQAFCLKGSNPVHVYSDLARTVDVTGQATVTPGQPLANTSSKSLSCFPSVQVTTTVPAGELRYITVHLGFAGKCATGFASNADTTYRQPFTFTETVALGGFAGQKQDVTPFTGVGKKVTAIGGVVLDTNLLYKSGLTVKLFDGVTLLATSYVTPPDGFYFADVPLGGPYTVKLFNPSGEIPGKSASVSVAKDEYVAVDFLNINPADPVIEGFVFDASTQGIAGVTVNLHRITGQASRQLGSMTTGGGGWYAFRFAAPGDYRVEIIVPEGYTSNNTASTVSLEQFEIRRVDFTLNGS